MTRSRAALVALTLLAALLHFHALDAQSLWYDEGFSVWLAQQGPAQIVARTAADIQPPLYYLLLHGWIRLTGSSEFALRLLSALCAVATVPLIAQLAYRLLHSQEARILAALLAALSPLWLWYGREVRMYALILLLLVGAAVALVALLRGQRRALLPAVLLLIAATYSHYFAWFVVAAWALVAGLVALRQRALLRAVALAFALPLLAYLPWIGITLTRLQQDRSYWQGLLRPAQVIRSALASWIVGHSMHQAVAEPIGLFGGLLALLGLLALAIQRQRGQRRQMWLLLAWLIGPILGLLLLSWNRPKYHPRYLIFAAPAFLLLQSALLAWLLRRGRAGRLAALALALSLVAISVVADRNLFTDPAFAKDDWRGVATYLATHRQPDEPLLLVSGHAFPVLDYYYPAGASAIRLPDEPTLDTTAVLGPDLDQQLARKLQGASRVWRIGWEDEVVDPEQVVPTFLRVAGGTSQPLPSFHGVRLDAWALPPGVSLAQLLEPQQRTDSRFGEALTLLGWSPPVAPAPADSGLAVTLYWQAQRALTADYKVKLTVVDEQGNSWGELDQRPTAYTFPTFRWQPDRPRLAAVTVPLKPGTPPGSYWLLVTAYEEGGPTLDLLDRAGAPQGQALRVGPIRVEPAAINWSGARPDAGNVPPHPDLLGDTDLVAGELEMQGPLAAGQRIPLALWWRTGGPLPEAMLHLGWQQGGTLVAASVLPPGGAGWPSDSWTANQLLLTQTTLAVPRTLADGTVQLVAWLSDAEGHESRRIVLGEGRARATVRQFELPPIQHPQAASFGDQIALLGYDLSPDSPDPGPPVTLTLHWQALADPPESLTLFAHLLTADGQIVPGAGQDLIPLDGARPTDSWVAGEIVSTPVTLALPADATVPPYQIEIGWYNAARPDFPRLPASGDGADGDRVLLR